MATKDYYKILGLKAGEADQSAIKKAYRGFALRNHPDVIAAELRHNATKTDVEKEEIIKAAKERFQEIGEAYEVLSDPEKKHNYDRSYATFKGDSRQEFYDRFYDAMREKMQGNAGGSWEEILKEAFEAASKGPHKIVKDAEWHGSYRGKNGSGQVVINDLVDVLVEKICYQYLNHNPLFEVQRETTLHDAVIHGFDEVGGIDFYQSLATKLHSVLDKSLTTYIKSHTMETESNMAYPWWDKDWRNGLLNIMTSSINDVRRNDLGMPQLEWGNQDIRYRDAPDRDGSRVVITFSEKQQELIDMIEYVIENRQEIMTERAALRGTPQEGQKKLGAKR